MQILKRLKRLIRSTTTRQTRRNNFGFRADQLESRQLLTLGVNFDFTVIGSDLSSDLRLFGSTDPGDAPMEVLRYGSGSVTGVQDFDSNGLLDPGRLTFEFGSMDVNNPVEAIRLDRASFDDGIADGVANQNYVANRLTGPIVTFYHDTQMVGTTRLLSINLEVLPDGTTTGSGQFDYVDAVAGDTNAIFANINSTFGWNNNNNFVNFTLGTFAHNGAWAGVEDAEIYSSDGTVISGDDAPDDLPFATHWNIAQPFDGAGQHSHDEDRLKTTLDPNQRHTFRIDTVGDGGWVSFHRALDASPELGQSSFHSQPYQNGEVTLLSITPQSAMTYVTLDPDRLSSYSIQHLGSEPASLNVYFMGNESIGWSAKYDGNFNEQTADGYRVEISNGNGIFHTQDVSSDTMTFSYAGLLGVSQQSIRVGRIVGSAVTDWSEARRLEAVRTSTQIDSFDGKTLTWAAIPGAEEYELVFENSSERAFATTNSYTLPENHPTGWRRVWVRPVFVRRFTTYNYVDPLGGWSPTFHYHARSAMAAPQVSLNGQQRLNISWTARPGSASYEIVVIRKSDRQITDREAGLTGTSWTSRGSYDPDQYDVWIRSASTAGIVSCWSAATTLSTIPEPVQVTGMSDHATFEWTDSAGVVAADIYIVNGGRVIYETGLNGTSYNETSGLANGPLSWWVRGTKSSGEKTAWSSRSFVRVGNTAVQTYPHGLQMNTSGHEFSWDPVLGVQSYELFIRNWTYGDQQITNLTDTSRDDVSLLAGRNVIWVKSVFPDNSFRFSNPVTVDVATGHLRVLTTPSGIVGSNTPTINWIDPGNGSGTRLWVRHVESNTNSQYDQPGGDSYIFATPLTPGTYRIWATRLGIYNYGAPITIIVT